MTKETSEHHISFLSDTDDSLSDGSREVLTTDAQGNAKLASFPAATLNKLYMDTSFSGSPAQCDPVTCELMKKEIKFAATQGLEESFNYKYYMDVDGNGWSGRFHRLLWSNSLVLKVLIPLLPGQMS